MVIQDFDGELRRVRANRLRVCLPTKSCFTFFSKIVALFIALIASMTMMIVLGTTNPSFLFWSTVFSFAIGVLVPSPTYEDEAREGNV